MTNGWSRASDHIVRIRPPRLHAVGDPKAEALKVSLEKLERWRGEIDEMMVDLLIQDLA